MIFKGYILHARRPICQIIFTIYGHSIPIDKLNKAYTYQKIYFAHNQHGKKLILAKHEITLTISALDLLVKEQIAEQ